ncbi:MAG: DUF2207 domain-containing protein [Chloroflexi bacterium]|nr:DUF2207 domain-containing protein [Chloroflexota bacterium]
MKRFHWILLLGLIATLFLTGAARAQSKSFYWERFDANIHVLPNGDFIVEEIQEIVFTSGDFHFGYRNIPMGRLEHITDVEVWEGGRQYERGSGGEYTFETYTDEGDFIVKWYFPYTSDSSHTFILRYTVQGGLRYYEEGDQLFWKAVYPDRDFSVHDSTVTVYLPQGAVAGEVVAYDTEAVITGQGSNTVTFTAQETLEPGQELEVYIKFPHGIVQGAAPGWQAAYDRQAEWESSDAKAWLDLGLGFVGALLVLGGPLSLLMLWYLRGRDPKIVLPAAYLPEPPTDDPPGVAGTLVDEKADMQDIIATLVDLARRGYLAIEEEHKSGFFGSTSFDFVFRRTEKSTDDLLPYERMLLRQVFGGRSERRMSSLKNKFYQAIPKIKEQLYRETVKRKYFRASPDKTRGRYNLFGFLLLMGAIFGGGCASMYLYKYTAMIICPAIGIGVTAIGMIIVGQWMPAKTRKGAEQAAWWNAFKHYLAEIERYTDMSQATELFEKYLPYAIAFGLDRSWVRKFSRLETTQTAYVPMPLWYVPSRSGRRVSGLGRAVDAGGGAPSLQQMSDGMTGGLQSMSDGLTSMLNTAGSTLSSSPSSSGSGGGGGGGGGGGFG